MDIVRFIYGMIDNNVPWVVEVYTPNRCNCPLIHFQEITVTDNVFNGAVFVTKNYQAKTHTDHDQSQWTVVIVLGADCGGYFYSAAHEWAIPLLPKSMFWFRSDVPHGTTAENITKTNGIYSDRS